jgi:mannitol/fructose-specific phosphotransferase system IIA component (Ntr-type)
MLNERARLLRNEVENEIEVDEVITHNSRAALISYAEEEQPHWVVFDWKEPSSWGVLIGMDEWWLEDFPTDALFFDDRGNQTFEKILVITDPGPYDGEVVYAADHVGEHENGHATFLNPVPQDEEKRDHTAEFQAAMMSMCSISCDSALIDAEDWVSSVIERTEEADLLIIGGLLEEPFPGFDGQERGREIIEDAECSVARIKSSLRSPRSVFSHAEQFEEEDKSQKSLHEHLEPDQVYTDWIVAGPDELFTHIADHLSNNQRERAEIESRLEERERIQSTCIGNGIALPHAIVDSMEETRLLISVLPEPIVYRDSGDEVRICVAIIGPASDRQEHLELISNVSKWLMDDDVREFLLSGASSEEIYETLLDLGTGETGDDG